MRRYYELFADPRSRRSMIAAALARHPITVAPIALLLIGYQTYDSFAAGGVLAGAHAFASASLSGVHRKLAARWGMRTLLLGAAVGYVTAIAALLGSARAEAPLPVLVLAAIAAGATVPHVAMAISSVTDRPSADSGLMETVSVSGPLLLALLSALSSARFALAFTALAAGACTAILSLDHRIPARAKPSDDRSAPARPMAVAFILTSVLCILFGFGAMDVGLAVFAGGGAATGLLVALWAAGAVLGGLWPWTPTGQLLTGYRWSLVGLGAGHLPLILAAKPVTLGVLLVVAGASIAPLMAYGGALLREAAGAAVGVPEWVSAVGYAGLAAGAVAGGAVADNQAQANSVLAIGAVAPLCALIVATVVQWILTLVLTPAGRHRQRQS